MEEEEVLSIKTPTTLCCPGIFCCASAGSMVVIIISVSLALLVCAIIPLIFYIHWRSSPGEALPNVHMQVRSHSQHHAQTYPDEPRLVVSEARNKRPSSRAEVSGSCPCFCLKRGLTMPLVHSQGSHGAVELQALNASESSARGAVYQPLEA